MKLHVRSYFYNIGNPFGTYPKSILKRRRVVVPGGRVPRGQLDLDSKGQNDSLKLGFKKAMKNTPLALIFKNIKNFLKSFQQDLEVKLQIIRELNVR